MKNSTIIILLIGILACQQSEEPDKLQSPLSLVTDDINYSAYSWYYPTGQWKFYLDYFLHIDKKGDFSLMLRDTSSKAKYFTGTVNDTIRKLINQTFSVDTFTTDYKSELVQNIAYSGYTYCFDYKKEKENRKRVVFIQIRSPETIKTLSNQLDKFLKTAKRRKLIQ